MTAAQLTLQSKHSPDIKMKVIYVTDPVLLNFVREGGQRPSRFTLKTRDISRILDWSLYVSEALRAMREDIRSRPLSNASITYHSKVSVDTGHSQYLDIGTGSPDEEYYTFRVRCKEDTEDTRLLSQVSADDFILFVDFLRMVQSDLEQG